MIDEPLERSTNSNHANGAAQAPRSMQWAVRNTQNQRTPNTAPSSTSTPAGKLQTFFFHPQNISACLLHFTHHRVLGSTSIYIYIFKFFLI